MSASRAAVKSRMFATSRSGVAAVEFALVVPVLMLFLSGTIEFGLVIFTINNAQSATYNTARKLATNRIGVGAVSKEVIQQLPSWVRSATTVTVTQTSPDDSSKNTFIVDTSFSMSSATPLKTATIILASSIVHCSVQLQQEYAP